MEETLPATVPVSLHNHGEYSLLESLLRMEDMVRAARAFGMTALGLTDRNTISGCVAFAKACLNGEPKVHPVIGCELILEGGFPLVLLAQNDDGYGNLCEILSRDTHEFHPISWQKLKRLASGLICLTGGQDAEVPQLLKVGKNGPADDLARRISDLFPGNTYLELTWHRPSDVISCLRIQEMAERLQLPMVAGANSRTLRPQDYRALEMLGSIRTLTLLDQPAPGKITKATHGSYAFLSPHKLTTLFSQYPGALENTLKIAQQCQVAKMLRL